MIQLRKTKILKPQWYPRNLTHCIVEKTYRWNGHQLWQSHSSSDADSCKNNGLWPRWKVPVVTSRLPQVKKKLFFFLITAIVWVLLSVIFHFPYFYSKASCLLCSLSILWHSVAFNLFWFFFRIWFISCIFWGILVTPVLGFLIPWFMQTNEVKIM